METKRPARDPNLTIKDLRTDIDECSIVYKLAHNKTDPNREEFWQIPHNSTFNPNIELEEGEAYAVWTEMIDVPYTTTKGKQRTKKRYDWIWVEPLAQYERESFTQSESGTKLKRKLIHEQMAKVDAEVSQLKKLFDGF